MRKALTSFSSFIISLMLISTALTGTTSHAQATQGGVAVPPPAPEINDSMRQLLAPTGKLRVGVYPGSPNSMIVGSTPDKNAGVGFELGRAFAQYLGVPFEPVVYQMNGEVLTAAKEKKVDFVFTNATPVRAEYIDFVEPVLLIEQSYIVSTNSKIKKIDDIDVPGVKVGVSAGSTSQATLPKLLKNATFVVTPNLQIAEQKIKSGEIDAFATNKAILFELADRLPNSTVLTGAWGYEKISAGLPKGREQGLALLAKFSEEMRQKGFVNEAAARAGLRGLKN